jgi:receptor protein-tyrosine kinase
MSLIEQAAKRLEELRRAGAALPDEPSSPTVPEGGAKARQEHIPTPEALVRELNTREASAAHVPAMRAVIGDESAKPRGRRVEPEAGPKVRAEVDLARLKELGFITPDAPQSQMANEFRVLKRPILQNARSATKLRNGNLVLVTSALPGEGKTFTAVNLAISMAMEYDHTVLLVDGDVAHPALPDLLNLPQSPGLLDLLIRDDLDIDDVVLQTNIEKLTVLSAGSRHRRATELLASEKMATLLSKLASRYTDRIIIFDSPPLLATTEARVISTHMGQIVMVVAADATAQHTVRQGLATIENCEVVLMMLNKAAKTDVGTYYGYPADDDLR